MGGYPKYKEAVESGLQFHNPDLKDQLAGLKQFVDNDMRNLEAANKAGGKTAFAALSELVKALGIESTLLRKEYETLSSKLRKEYAETYRDIKDLYAFKNYQQLVDANKLTKATKYSAFVDDVKKYQE